MSYRNIGPVGCAQAPGQGSEGGGTPCHAFAEHELMQQPVVSCSIAHRLGGALFAPVLIEVVRVEAFIANIIYKLAAFILHWAPVPRTIRESKSRAESLAATNQSFGWLSGWLSPTVTKGMPLLWKCTGEMTPGCHQHSPTGTSQSGVCGPATRRSARNTIAHTCLGNIGRRIGWAESASSHRRGACCIGVCPSFATRT